MYCNAYYITYRGSESSGNMYEPEDRQGDWLIKPTIRYTCVSLQLLIGQCGLGTISRDTTILRSGALVRNRKSPNKRSHGFPLFLQESPLQIPHIPARSS